MVPVLLTALLIAPTQSEAPRPAWEFAADQQLVDDESTGRDDLAAAQYLPAPDPTGGHDAFAAQPTGCAALLLGFDQICLGGLVNRMYSRSISYGLCGALVGSLGGCLVGIIPVLFFASAIDDLNTSQGWTIPNGQSLILPCGLIGAVPGCLGGGGCGVGAGLASAFLFPFDPPPSQGAQPPPPGGYPPGQAAPPPAPDDNEPSIRHRAPRKERDRTERPRGNNSGRDGRPEVDRDGRPDRNDTARDGRGSRGRNDAARPNRGRRGQRPPAAKQPPPRTERNKKRTIGERKSKAARDDDEDEKESVRPSRERPTRSPR